MEKSKQEEKPDQVLNKEIGFKYDYDRLHQEYCILMAVLDGIILLSKNSTCEQWTQTAIQAQQYRFYKAIQEELGISLAYLDDRGGE